MRWCRFSFEEACRLAEEHVNNYKVMGKTWAEYDAWRKEKVAHSA